jgi:hypothetical protein
LQIFNVADFNCAGRSACAELIAQDCRKCSNGDKTAVARKPSCGSLAVQPQARGARPVHMQHSEQFKETTMSGQRNLLRNVAIGTIAAALVIPVMSAAQADQITRHTRRAKIYNHVTPAQTMNRPGLMPNAVPAAEVYPTWPEGSPDYHGSNG